MAFFFSPMYKRSDAAHFYKKMPIALKRRHLFVCEARQNKTAIEHGNRSKKDGS